MDRLTFDVPGDVPTVNQIIELAKGPGHGIRYRRAKRAYQMRARIETRRQHRRPPEPWKRWALVEAHIRSHNLRDRLELRAGLKWLVDELVKGDWVEDDSHLHLLECCEPTQSIERDPAKLGVRITIEDRNRGRDLRYDPSLRPRADPDRNHHRPPTRTGADQYLADAGHGAISRSSPPPLRRGDPARLAPERRRADHESPNPRRRRDGMTPE